MKGLGKGLMAGGKRVLWGGQSLSHMQTAETAAAEALGKPLSRGAVLASRTVEGLSNPVRMPFDAAGGAMGSAGRGLRQLAPRVATPTAQVAAPVTQAAGQAAGALPGAAQAAGQAAGAIPGAAQAVGAVGQAAGQAAGAVPTGLPALAAPRGMLGKSLDWAGRAMEAADPALSAAGNQIGNLTGVAPLGATAAQLLRFGAKGFTNPGAMAKGLAPVLGAGAMSVGLPALLTKSQDPGASWPEAVRTSLGGIPYLVAQNTPGIQGPANRLGNALGLNPDPAKFPTDEDRSHMGTVLNLAPGLAQQGDQERPPDLPGFPGIKTPEYMGALTPKQLVDFKGSAAALAARPEAKSRLIKQLQPDNPGLEEIRTPERAKELGEQLSQQEADYRAKIDHPDWAAREKRIALIQDSPQDIQQRIQAGTATPQDKQNWQDLQLQAGKQHTETLIRNGRASLAIHNMQNLFPGMTPEQIAQDVNDRNPESPVVQEGVRRLVGGVMQARAKEQASLANSQGIGSMAGPGMAAMARPASGVPTSTSPADLDKGLQQVDWVQGFMNLPSMAKWMLLGGAGLALTGALSGISGGSMGLMAMVAPLLAAGGLYASGNAQPVMDWIGSLFGLGAPSASPPLGGDPTDPSQPSIVGANPAPIAAPKLTLSEEAMDSHPGVRSLLEGKPTVEAVQNLPGFLLDLDPDSLSRFRNRLQKNPAMYAQFKQYFTQAENVARQTGAQTQQKALATVPPPGGATPGTAPAAPTESPQRRLFTILHGNNFEAVTAADIHQTMANPRDADSQRVKNVMGNIARTDPANRLAIALRLNPEAREALRQELTTSQQGLSDWSMERIGIKRILEALNQADSGATTR